MIGQNPLRTKTLITVDEVVFHGPTDNLVDGRILLQSIIVAETRFILPLLGSKVYSDITDAKNVLVTADNKSSLQTELNEGRTGRDVIVLTEGDYVNSDEYLDDIQKELWHDHLHKITAECVVFCAMPGNRARFTAKGVTKNFPATIGGSGESASVDLFELKHLMDRTLWYRINPLISAMHSFMCTTSYPRFDKQKPVAPKSNGISLSMYDDDDEDDKRRCRW